MRTGKILTFAAIMLAAVVSGCSNGNKQDMHTDTSEVVFSRQGGVYDEEFELELTSKGIIYYTTDGSDPSESDTSIKYDGEIKVADRSGGCQYRFGCISYIVLHQFQRLFQG